MKKTVVMMAAMMLMAGGMAFAQQPEQPEAPKQENPAPEQKPDGKERARENGEDRSSDLRRVRSITVRPESFS